MRLARLCCALGATLSLMSPQAWACKAKTIPFVALASVVQLGKDEQVTQAWTCTDSTGEQIIVASRQVSTGSIRGTQLAFYKLVKAASGWKRVWQARDFQHDVNPPAREGLREVLSTVDKPLAGDTVVLKDVDGDGLAEVFIAYKLPGRTGEPDTGKLLVFYKDQKYAIRGAVARTSNDFGSRKLSDGFLNLPASVQKQALQLWDQFSTPAGHPSAPGHQLLLTTEAPAAGPGKRR
jgi:hypothetical protein